MGFLKKLIKCDTEIVYIYMTLHTYKNLLIAQHRSNLNETLGSHNNQVSIVPHQLRYIYHTNAKLNNREKPVGWEQRQ